MKILYYNAFLCRNGVKTKYSLHNLFDFIENGSPMKRTQELNQNKIVFLSKTRNKKARKNKDNTVPGFEFINTNRTMWIGKFNDDKPFTGSIGSDVLKQIKDELYQPNICLSVSSEFLFLMEYNFLGPRRGQIEKFLSSYIENKKDDVEYDVRLFPVPTEKMLDIIPASESIKSVTLTINNDGFKLGDMFPELSDDKKTLFEKLISSPVEVSNDLDVNQTTIVLKKGRRKKQMDIVQISDILKLISFDSDTVASAVVEFKHPGTGENKKVNLKHDGQYTGVVDSDKFADFELLATLLTEHYYDKNHRNKDNYYTKYSFTEANQEEFDFVYPKEISNN